MTAAPPDAAFLDLDGCLVDSRSAISHCLNVGLEAVGATPRAVDRLHHLIGPPLHESFVALLAEEELDPALAPRCVAAYREAYRDVSLTETRPVPGVADALSRVQGHLPLAVVTSKPAAFAEPILEVVRLAGFFAAVHAPSLHARAEPKAETLARALADVAPSSPRASTVMVGDRHHDVDAGRACGTGTVGVTWGIGDRAEVSHADVLLDEPAGLAALLRSR